MGMLLFIPHSLMSRVSQENRMLSSLSSMEPTVGMMNAYGSSCSAVRPSGMYAILSRQSSTPDKVVMVVARAPVVGLTCRSGRLCVRKKMMAGKGADGAAKHTPTSVSTRRVRSLLL